MPISDNGLISVDQHKPTILFPTQLITQIFVNFHELDLLVNFNPNRHFSQDATILPGGKFHCLLLIY